MHCGQTEKVLAKRTFQLRCRSSLHIRTLDLDVRRSCVKYRVVVVAIRDGSECGVPWMQAVRVTFLLDNCWMMAKPQEINQRLWVSSCVRIIGKRASYLRKFHTSGGASFNRSLKKGKRRTIESYASVRFTTVPVLRSSRACEPSHRCSFEYPNL